MGTTLFDDPLMLHCKAAAQDWLHSDDPLVQDFGARLMFILSSQDVSLSQRGKNVPPEGLLPEEFQHYPWDIGTLLGKAEYKKHEFQSEAPMRQFYAFEDLEHVALRLGVFWTSPHWHYSPHVYKSLELHHRVCGQGQYFTSNGGQVESMDMSPGDIYVHLPSTMYGFESWDEPLLTLWAERVVDVDQVPRVIRDVQEVRADLVTSTLTRAAHLWLQAEDVSVQRFGRKLLPFLHPRSMRRVVKDAPPLGAVPKAFRSCPWYPSLAYTQRMDAALKPLRDCIMYKNEDSMFGMFYLPAGIYYPAHRHEPMEIYHVIQGEARFFSADDGMSSIQEVDGVEASIETWGPDSFWVHQPYQSHGLQTLDHPVLILWGWIGDLKDFDFHYLPGDIFQSAKLQAKL